MLFLPIVDPTREALGCNYCQHGDDSQIHTSGSSHSHVAQTHICNWLPSRLDEKWKLATQNWHDARRILVFPSKTCISPGLLSWWMAHLPPIFSSPKLKMFSLNLLCLFRNAQAIRIPLTLPKIFQIYPIFFISTKSSNLWWTSNCSSCFPSCYPTIHFPNGNHDSSSDNLKLQTNLAPPLLLQKLPNTHNEHPSSKPYTLPFLPTTAVSLHTTLPFPTVLAILSVTWPYLNSWHSTYMILFLISRDVIMFMV